MLLSFLIAVLIFMLPFIIISLFVIFDKNWRIRETWKVLFKKNMPKYHLFFLFQCGLVGWIGAWIVVVAVYHNTLQAVERYFAGARRRANRLFERANDIFDNLAKPFGIDTL